MLRFGPIVRLRCVLTTSLSTLAHRQDLLELEARRRVFEWIRTYPGIHLREIARALSMDPNHAKYHLGYLERHGLVSSQRHEGYLRFYAKTESAVGPAETVAPPEKELLALLRRRLPLHVIVLLLERGEASVSQLVEAVGVARATLHYHLGKLERAGVVTSRHEGREHIYRVVEPDRVRGHVMRYRPPDALVAGFLDAWDQLEIS